ncbi:MAG: PHB depolymerase family esterase [Thermoguttaceae bacterium]|nr:PHB depolymerase family esterase [Thermoguttaceae bacterium]
MPNRNLFLELLKPGLVLAVVAWTTTRTSDALAAEIASSVPARPSGGKGGQAGLFRNERIQVGNQEREYRLLVPKTATGDRPAPILFAFHGFLIDSKDLMPLYTQLDRLAEQKGFIVVYPNGKNRAWRLLPTLAQEDIAFFDALLEHLAARYNIDLNRVYLAGMSNGAYFVHLLARERSDRIAAICAHSGGLGVLAADRTGPKHKYAVFLAHGDKDSIVPVSESRKAHDQYQKWGHPVQYVEVPGWGHLWAVKAGVNEKMWTFFLAHPLSVSPGQPKTP